MHAYQQGMSRTFTTELEMVHISEDLTPTKTTYHLKSKLISEDSSLLGCYALSLDEQCMTSQRIIGHSSSGSKCRELLPQQNGVNIPESFIQSNNPVRTSGLALN
jgi:hypothetical protein